MSNTPTRSEIESALSGSNAPTHRGRHQKTHDEGTIYNEERSKTVIGGDITGVAKRHSHKRFNLINWIAAGVVLLVSIVFFWPQAENINKPKGVDAVIEKDNAPQIKQSFAKEGDLQRAQSYRLADEKEQKIDALIEQAEELIQANKRVSPYDQSALAKYRQILQIDTSNRKARAGLNNLIDHFYQQGTNALEAGDFAQVEKILPQLGAISKQSTAYLELTGALQKQKTLAKTNALLKSAEQAFANNNHILPARNNALYFYQQIIDYDPKNKKALQGIEKTANHYVELANKAILTGDYDLATGYLSTVGVISPEHESIEILKEMISYGQEVSSSQNQSKPEREIKFEEENTTPTAKQEIAPTSTETAKQPNVTTPANSTKTPARESNEQELFDRQYLTNGLTAYYQGDYEKARALLQPLADKGISRAQLRIGYMHYFGRGFEQNKDEADRIIRAALPAVKKFAEEGRPWAQSDIASLYEDGLVLPKDTSEAVYWYRRAAEQGYPGAQTNLGIMYANGRGVSRSRKTAIEWFQLAAKQGDELARRNLQSLGVEF